mgnify:CR=1 FL=1
MFCGRLGFRLDKSDVPWVALGVPWGSFGAPAGLTWVLFGFILGSKGFQNCSKIDPNMNPFFYAILEVFWMAFWNEDGTV